MTPLKPNVASPEKARPRPTARIDRDGTSSSNEYLRSFVSEIKKSLGTGNKLNKTNLYGTRMNTNGESMYLLLGKCDFLSDNQNKESYS